MGIEQSTGWRRLAAGSPRQVRRYLDRIAKNVLPLEANEANAEQPVATVGKLEAETWRLAARLALLVDCWTESDPHADLELVAVEPPALVTQLVGDLVVAPGAPPRPQWVLAIAA